jgi:hypothetical protein
MLADVTVERLKRPRLLEQRGSQTAQVDVDAISRRRGHGPDLHTRCVSDIGAMAPISALTLNSSSSMN